MGKKSLEIYATVSNNGPKPGDEAPDFELPLLGDSARKVRLSSFRAKKPVALIFGSFT